MLVVDGSTSIMPNNFDTLIQFVVRVTRQFDISPEATRMGLVQFSDRSDVEIGLGNSTSYRSIVAFTTSEKCVETYVIVHRWRTYSK